MQFPNKVEGRSYKVKYANNEWIDSLTIEGNLFEIKNSYYLSGENNRIFDEGKIGHTKNGKFIITNTERKNPKTGPYKEVGVFEILKLTETDLQMKNLRNNSILIFKSKETE